MRRQKTLPKSKSANSPPQKPQADFDSPDEIRTAVRHTALRLLARREHGRAELRDKLLGRGHPLQAIEEVLGLLAEHGLQCDHRFAESYTRMRVLRGYGVLKIRAELQSRELDTKIIEQALYDYRSDWAANAEAVLRKKYDENEFVGFNARELAKAKRFLWSRGYNSTDITIAVRRILQPVH